VGRKALLHEHKAAMYRLFQRLSASTNRIGRKDQVQGFTANDLEEKSLGIGNPKRRPRPPSM
jgi:hypothetical protein